MIFRPLLLRSSRSPWLADQFRRRAFARRAVRRFVPGEAPEAALDAADRIAVDGCGAVLTQLGERTTSRDDALAVRDHYLGLLATIQQRGAAAQISVKPTHLGLDVDPEGCAESLIALAALAEETGSFVWIDMEESIYVDRTLELFRRARAEHRAVGICLQAYLRRTPEDLESLLPLAPAIRLVKGAYREPEDVAFSRRLEIDAAFLALAGRLLDQVSSGALPVFGTHDLELVGRIAAAAPRDLPPHAYEVHMLYGIQTQAQRSLAQSGLRVRVLVSYGTHWFAWYMRRLAERPVNLWYLLKSAASRDEPRG